MYSIHTTHLGPSFPSLSSFSPLPPSLTHSHSTLLLQMEDDDAAGNYDDPHYEDGHLDNDTTEGGGASSSSAAPTRTIRKEELPSPLPHTCGHRRLEKDHVGLGGDIANPATVIPLCICAIPKEILDTYLPPVWQEPMKSNGRNKKGSKTGDTSEDRAGEGSDMGTYSHMFSEDAAMNGRILANSKEAALADSTTHKYNVQEFVLWLWQKYRVGRGLPPNAALLPTEEKLLLFCQERKILRFSKNVSKKQRLASSGGDVFVAKADIKKVGQSVSKYYQYLVAAKVISATEYLNPCGKTFKAYKESNAKKQASNFKLNREDPHKGTYAQQSLSSNEYRKLGIESWNKKVRGC